MQNTPTTELTTREPKISSEVIMIATRDSLSVLACSENEEEDGEDVHDEFSKLGKLSVDDEPSWVVGTISKRVLQRMERF
jgi:hypothetical protein